MRKLLILLALPMAMSLSGCSLFRRCDTCPTFNRIEDKQEKEVWANAPLLPESTNMEPVGN